MPFEQLLPKSLSPSRLADFQACPRRYQYASVERIPQPASYATAKGRLAHYVFEHLFLLGAPDRSPERARAFIEPAIEAVLTDDVRTDIAMDDEMLARLVLETHGIIDTYFEMEDPREVKSEGVEMALGVDVEGTPLFGILDRLDRNPDGSLTIVDYKTGAVPNRNYDTKTFANAELYAALCAAKLGELPTTIRLLYVAKGAIIERNVTDVVVRARSEGAARAWGRINSYYGDGAFPATPSLNACRFCSFTTICKSSGVPVPVR